MSDFRPVRLLTRCPACMQTVEARLDVADNEQWTMAEHTPSLVSTETCSASAGRWRRLTPYLGGSGKWHDAWERPKDGRAG